MLEKRFDSDFWQKRQNWPKEKIDILEDLPKIEKRAVVKDDFVEAKEVVITKDNPLGVWCYGNMEVIEIAKYCFKNSFKESLNFINEISTKKGAPQNFVSSFKNWLISQKILIK